MGWSDRMKTVDWYAQGAIPGLIYFKNGSVYTGSVNDFGNKTAKEFRYVIKPNDGSIKAEVWYGPCCYERSEILDQAEFSMDEDGRSKMLGWMKKKYESMIE